MSQSILIDIGTHKAQELRVLSGESLYIFNSYLYWWFDWFKIQIKKIIRYKGLIQYGYGKGTYILSPIKMSFKHHLSIIKQIVWSKNYLEYNELILIEPATEVAATYVKKLRKKLNLTYLPVAVLPHNENKTDNFVNFYVCENSLSSSLYDEKREKQYSTICPAFSFDEIINYLMKLNYINNDTKIAIRMNCEGSELGIIKSFISYNLIPEFILGSINDVQKKHGDEAHEELNDILKEHNIVFNYFKGTDPATWEEGFTFIKNFV